MKGNAAALAFVFADEGGYAERPTEGGGAVNMGITFETFSAWRKSAGKPVPNFADLKAMTKAEASEIYNARYLAPINFDVIPVGIDYAVLDAAVLGGVGRSLKALNQALRLNDIKQGFTPVTKWEVQHREPVEFINRLCDQRIVAYWNLKPAKLPIKVGSTRTWGKVWEERIDRVRKRALAMAASVPQTVPVVDAPKPAPTAKTPVVAPLVVPATAKQWLVPPKGDLKGCIGLNLSVVELEAYLRTLKFGAFWPKAAVLHNTHRPTLEQWYATPGGTRQRLRNLWEGHFRKIGFKGGPHILVEADDDTRPIWVGNPLDQAGTHSPSWNSTTWGIEMVGDYQASPFDPAVKKNTVAMLAVLHKFLGLGADTMRFHKEDPRTAHKTCPGRNVSKPEMIKLVAAAMAAR